MMHTKTSLIGRDELIETMTREARKGRHRQISGVGGGERPTDGAARPCGFACQ